MDDTIDFADYRRRMDGAVTNLRTELSGLRSGRASTSMLEPVQVDAYGAKMPLQQVATVSVPEPRMISVQVWDRGMVQAVEKAIRESNLGLNPVTEGQTLRIPIPELNEERRLEFVKVANKYAEAARVAVRQVRRQGMDEVKKRQKDIGEDEARGMTDRLQKETDEVIKYLLVGQRVWQLDFTGGEEYLITTNGNSNDVSFVDVDALEVVKSSQVGQQPWGVVVRTEAMGEAGQ